MSEQLQSPIEKNRRKRQYRSHRENKIDKRKHVRSAKPKP